MWCECLCALTLYVVETTTGTYEWRTLPLEHTTSKNFLDSNPADEFVLPGRLPLVNLERWVAGGELIADTDTEPDSDMSEG